MINVRYFLIQSTTTLKCVANTFLTWLYNRFAFVGVLVLAGFLSITLSACSKSEESDQQTASEKSTQEVFLGEVLVTVNDHSITELDLDLAIERTIGTSSLAQMDNQARKKVLESLVMSKSLALKKQSELSAEELTQIERNVMAYRDELLAKKYLKENISPLPVTETMVKDYYEQNPQMFGADIQKRYEIIQGKDNLAAAERKAIISALNTAQTQQNWKVFAQSLQDKNLSVNYSQGAMTQGTMAAEFERILKPLEKGQTSPVFFMRKLPAIVRVTEVIIQKAKPLSDVSRDIRKQLAPVQLKKAIRSSADNVMKTMTIDYK